MKIIGITGGIGSGKTIVCQVFNKLGIPVYDADKFVHNIYEKYPEVSEKIIKEISDDVVDKNGKINRKKLGEIFFNDADKLKILNSIVHPLVKTNFNKWVHDNSGYPYVLKEAAILFESGASENCFKVITVFSPMELRFSRIRERDHKSRTEAEFIIDRQINDEERIKKSDYVIYNDEKQLLIPQILKIHSSLIK